MRSRTALVVAVIAIFFAAMVADYAGLVDRPAPSGDALHGATEHGAAAHGPGDAVFTSATEKQLRLGLVGGFAVLAFYVILRHRGDI